jgi:hypothetical protein
MTWQCRLTASMVAIVVICTVMVPRNSDAADEKSLWGVYLQTLRDAKYVDLTRTITPKIPVWAGFADSATSQQSLCAYRHGLRHSRPRRNTPQRTPFCHELR